jgi:hypothetical protein
VTKVGLKWRFKVRGGGYGGSEFWPVTTLIVKRRLRVVGGEYGGAVVAIFSFGVVTTVGLQWRF